MKKLYAIAFALFLGAASMWAQNNSGVRFVTVSLDNEEVVKTGDVEDGAVINANTVTDDGFDDPFISTGLGIENTSDKGKRVQVKYEILKLDNGAVQCCFSTCKDNNALGTYYTPMLSQSGNYINLPVVKKGEVKDLAGEWKYTGTGAAVVKFTILMGTKNSSKTDAEGTVYDVEEGQSVTVNFLNGVSAIASVNAKEAVKTTYYDLAGRKVAVPSKGIYVQKQLLTDGTVVAKKIVKE